MCGVAHDGVVHEAACDTRELRPRLEKNFPCQRNQSPCRAFNNAWNTEVHLLPINWQPASNAFELEKRIGSSRKSSPPGGGHRPAARMAAACQEQLAKAAEQLRFFQAGDVRPTSRAVRTLARSEVALRARSRRRAGCQGTEHPRRHCGLAAASDSTKATTTQDRVPAILGTSADRVSACPRRNCLAAAADPTGHHPHPRHEAGGDGRGEAVRGRRSAVHLRLLRIATTARRW